MDMGGVYLAMAYVPAIASTVGSCVCFCSGTQEGADAQKQQIEERAMTAQRKRKPR